MRSNRLADATSPYLLQHAHNPVDWWPWCDDAFEHARARDVPVFLSIGYSTCYWCHVMERESFEDAATARLVNDRFVAVKIDREERPDLDDLYMAATQVMTGRGGWPMTVFVEPSARRPFWCGTYFPVEPRHGLPSFADVLRGISRAWAEQRDDVLAQAASLSRAVADHLAPPSEPVRVGVEHVQAAAAALLEAHDRVEGGFGGAPKFPQPVYLELLLDAADAASDDPTRLAVDAAVRHTLDRMAVGGLFDQIGGGFHRYCVDPTWTVPHFEKMLYDNAQLAEVYLRAAETYGDDYYRQIASRTLHYTLTEMTAEDGGFRSAQDAEVGGREGLNYLWTREQFDAVLGADAPWAARLYGLDRGPNFRDPHHPGDPPASVPRLDARPDPAHDDRRARVNASLYAARAARAQPRIDDKAVAAWNGMMIATMARASRTLGEPRFADAARRAATLVLTRMRTADGGLCRALRAGRAAPHAVLEDYAFVVRGLAALHDARVDGGPWLEEAVSLAAAAFDRFGDGRGSLYDTPADRTDVFFRASASYDGAMPSGRGAMLHACLDLYRATADARWLDHAVDLARSLSPEIAERPVAVANAARGLLRLLRAARGVAARLDPGREGPPPAPPRQQPPQHVAVFADAERVRVREDAPAVVHVILKVRDGWHVLAADPTPGPEDPLPGLRPFRVGLVSGEGVAVYADYPSGVPLDTAPPGMTGLMVYSGTVEIRVVLERAPGIGVNPGRPVLGVAFQACSDDACAPPAALELDIALDLD